jgi:type IV pilus assembly protein PilC
MPTFVYKALNGAGQPIKGEVDASTNEDAVAKIRQKGEFPTEVKAKAVRRGAGPAAAAGGPRPRRRGGHVPTKTLTQVTRQLSTLIDAGLPVLRSLRILEEQQKPGPMRLALRMVADDVEEGTPLSEAMGRHPKAFNRLYVNMVRAGELGGVLDVVLQRLSEFMERMQALRRKVIGAMIYPAAVITFAVLIVMGIMMFVIPKFKEIFTDMGEKLPAITQALLSISNWITGGGWAVILAMPVGIYFLIKLLKMSDGGRYAVDSFKLNIPLFGQIISKTAVARFSRTLGTLLNAGVPILEALNITRETAGNEVFSRAMLGVRDGIREGESFAEPLRQAKIVEPMVVNMIDVGEETGELDQMLEKVAETYDEEVETLVSSMVSMLEPVMVIVLGTIVGFIVIALFMPMVAMLQGMQSQA